LHGGLATVAATWDTVSLCESWAGIPVGDVFPEDQPDYHPGFVIYWSRNLVLERLPTGDALFKHRADISPRAAAAWQTYLVFTVYGCPASSPYPVPFTGPVWFF
jgi:hypothetical protein